VTSRVGAHLLGITVHQLPPLPPSGMTFTS
jgi:hypothetical protein